MISLEKVKIYTKYGGDVDGPVRMQVQADMDAMTSSDWGLIDAFFQDIHPINHRLTSKSYISKVLEKLTRNCTKPCSINFLESIRLGSDLPEVAQLLSKLKTDGN